MFVAISYIFPKGYITLLVPMIKSYNQRKLCFDLKVKKTLYIKTFFHQEKIKIKIDRSGIRTHATVVTGALNQRLRPLGHPALQLHEPIHKVLKDTITT